MANPPPQGGQLPPQGGRLPPQGGQLLVCRLGVVDYQAAWDVQRVLAEARRHDCIPDVLLLLQHPHTYTLGRRGKPKNVLLSAAELQRRQIALYHVDRGGDVTYHGPEQLVGYPIFKLPPERLDYVRYIRDVERAMLLAVRDCLGTGGDHGAELKEGYSGVWIGNDKVCAIGVKVDAYGVTTHGLALNVNTDLSYFAHIIPCGLTDKGVTSLQGLLQRRVSMRRVQSAVVRRMAETFDLTVQRQGRRRVRGMIEETLSSAPAGPKPLALSRATP